MGALVVGVTGQGNSVTFVFVSYRSLKVDKIFVSVILMRLSLIWKLVWKLSLI